MTITASDIKQFKKLLKIPEKDNLVETKKSRWELDKNLDRDIYFVAHTSIDGIIIAEYEVYKEMSIYRPQNRYNIDFKRI